MPDPIANETISAEWFASAFPDVASVMSPDEQANLLGRLSHLMAAHIEDNKLDLLHAMREEAGAARSKNDAFVAGYTKASSEAAGLKLAVETLTATRESAIAAAVAAERRRWNDALASLVEHDDRLGLATILLTTTSMSPASVTAAMGYVPTTTTTEPGADFARAMAAYRVGAPASPEPAPDVNANPANPSPAARVAWAAQFKGMPSPLANGITRPSAR